MTKIFEAYKKLAAGKPDFDFKLQEIGDIRLFPPPPDALQKEIARLANILLEFKPEERGISICMASSVPQEGASYISYNTACFLAYTFHRKVAWIDANFNSPQAKLEARGSLTFSDLIAEPDFVDDLPADGLLLLGGGANVRDRAVQGAGQPFREVMQRLCDKFDFAIVDCPPILENMETAHLAAYCDGLIAVIESGRLKREVIRSGLDSLATKKVQVLGAVLNRREYGLPKAIYDRL